ncbi:MAG: PilZ domain-containing protein [Vicinamibacterales bacterium]
MADERRRSARVRIVGEVHGRAVSVDQPVTVREISLGGLSLRTSFPFEVGTTHDIRLTLGDGAAVALRARVVHSRAVDQGPAAAYETGFEFLAEDAGVGGLIDRMR